MKTWYFLIFIIPAMACQSGGSVEKNKSEGPKINYYELGQEITAIAQAELMKNVQAAMEEGGPVHAIKFCNVHATPLSDSLSRTFNVEIGRVSLKNRNPLNKMADTEEALLLNGMLEASVEGMDFGDTVVASNGKLLYYRPIYIGIEACLKCHGQIGQDIEVKTMQALNELYPEDKATNYRMGEFRGVWKISFPLSMDN